MIIFQSTHPVWGATGFCNAHFLHTDYFNPRTPCGVRRGAHKMTIHFDGFQSTHPVWGATAQLVDGVTLYTNFNPRTPCGVRRGHSAQDADTQNFNPCTPCGVRRPHSAHPHQRLDQFQSTHPVWGATPARPASETQQHDFNPRTPCGVRRDIRLESVHSHNFNPRTPCGVRPGRRGCPVVQKPISIHAPRVGCDVEQLVLRRFRLSISIHAPRVGCDVGRGGLDGAAPDFNPRTPCGVRP